MPSKNSKSTDDEQAGIVIANDLRSGLTVFLTASGEWSESVTDALIVKNKSDAAGALLVAANDESANNVTGAYLADSNDRGQPLVLRESLRVHGPSVDYSRNSIVPGQVVSERMSSSQGVV